MCHILYNRRWYILLGTFIIFPLSVNVGLGCRFLDVNVESNHGYQSFGAFNVAIYDPEARGSSRFLGCVDLSLYWEEETSDDFGFTALRISSAFMLGFVSLATLICICIQCFSKHGKTHWWGLMRFCYIGATISQGAMYAIYFSDMCSTQSNEYIEGEYNIFISSTSPQCRPGTTGIIGVFNFALLCGMVIATLVSFPPRNPVFQCWDGDMEYTDESDDGSTSEEDSVMRKFKELGNADNDSVSLFGGSRKSRKSTKSRASGKGADDSASAAEMGIANTSMKSEDLGRVPTVSEERSVASGESAKKNKKAKSSEIIVETVESESVSTTRSKKSAILPVVKTLFTKTKAINEKDEKESIASDRKNTASVTEKKSHDENESFKKSEEEVASVKSVSSKTNNESAKSVGSNEVIILKPDNQEAKSVKSLSSKRSSKSFRSNGSKGLLSRAGNSGSLADYGLKSMSSTSGESTLEVTNFVIQLIEMTELGEGGRRAKLSDNENQVIIVDEYPIEEGGEIAPNSSADQIAVRTEYYDLGSRSTKEITHKDGSRTIVTTITVDFSSDSTTATPRRYPAPLSDPPVELTRSAGSIESAQSSKYQVIKSESSATSYTGTRRNKNQLKEGDLALSVATASTKR